MPRDAWTREQLLCTLALYCQIPFGKMDQRNPAVVSLAEDLGRTPSAVAFKLVNLASFDPELQRRGVRGMANASRLDREIWDEFYGKWEILADHTVVDQAERTEPDRLAGADVPATPPLGPTEVIREVSLRRGQKFFRAAVMAANDGMCCITGIASEPLLRASHIVPWALDPTLRLDPRNGLCLNALHDAAFDRGLITLTENLELRISKRLKGEVPSTVYKEMFESRESKPATIPERFRPTGDMLEFHRAKVFQP
ncbi:MAG: putative restriction endonuclease [Phycisphaerales bacterium]|jgi:putative restriction endonuclease